MKNINKKEVEILITSLSVMVRDERQKKLFVDDKGNIDLKKFNEMSMTKRVVEALRLMGVTNTWLKENGFMVASMILFLK